MPGYGYGGMNMSGPADWAAQQQAKQSDDFNQIIRLFLNLAQAKQEEGWKQKEFGANQQRYDNTLAQQALANKQWEARFGLNKQNIETDNARQAQEAKDRAENNRLAREQAALNEKDRAFYQKATLEDRAAARAEISARSNKEKSISRQISLLNKINDSLEKKKAPYIKQIEAAQKNPMIAYKLSSDPEGAAAALAPIIAPHKTALDSIEARQKQIQLLLAAVGSGGNILSDEDEATLRDTISGKGEPAPATEQSFMDKFKSLATTPGNIAPVMPSAPAKNMNTPDEFGFVIGQKRKGKDNKVYEYVGNDQWHPTN